MDPMSHPSVRRPLTVLVGVLAILLAGCGGQTGSDRPDRPLTLLLDFTPNGVHAGIYTALARQYDDAEGVRLRVRAPGRSTDSVRLLTSGRVDAAVLDIHDLGLARERGADLVGIAALVQQPLAAVLAQPEIRSPKDLEGERAGVSGLPSDRAVLRSVVRGAGGDPDRVKETTIGFEAVRALLGGRVAAATAFWNVEGVALREQRPGVKEFRVDDFGAPSYPELVIAVRRETLDDDADLLRALTRALQRGHSEAQKDPESAAGAVLQRARTVDRAALLAQIDAVAPAWTAGVPAFGLLSRARLREWAQFDVEFGILERAPDIERAFRFDLVTVPRSD